MWSPSWRMSWNLCSLYSNPFNLSPNANPRPSRLSSAAHPSLRECPFTLVPATLLHTFPSNLSHPVKTHTNNPKPTRRELSDPRDAHSLRGPTSLRNAKLELPSPATI
ncbi:Uncharacterized protein Adt_11648 [Abeliophyllum distichum]|uniref:Uncharacterized protein n=1 Tax=Abeliophyllum distichum TaxID=126358 RepID=A0ABD1UNI9_9LAMI